MKKIALALTLAFSAAAHAAEPPAATPAAEPTARPAPAPAARGPAVALALEAAQAALATCTANGYKAGVSVVDSAGVVRVQLLADGAGERAGASSSGKAFTVITYKVSSATVAKQAEADAALLAKLNADPKQRARAGALPLVVNGEVIGAIGVGGAPGGDKDEVCAAAGVDKIKDRLK